MARKDVPTDFCAEYPRKSISGTMRNPPPNPENEAPIPTKIPLTIITSRFAFIVSDVNLGPNRIYLDRISEIQ